MKIIDGSNKQMHAKIGIVVSRFNEPITQALLKGALERAQEKDLNDLTVVWVPGAVEIPFMADQLIRKEKVQAVVCLGAVIQGETDHYDYICHQVSEGCQKVMLQHQVPVVFGVLTTQNEEQAWDRAGGRKGHKGKEAIDVALEMLSCVSELSVL